MQELIRDVWRTLGTTILMVTHDLEEAVLLSKRIYVLSPRRGRVAAALVVTTSPPHPRPGVVLRDGETVSPLELFFDPVFVLAVSQCTALTAAEDRWLRGR